MAETHKCPSCGASIQVDESKEITTCQFCGSTFTTLDFFDERTKKRIEAQKKEEARIKQSNDAFKDFYRPMLGIAIGAFVLAIIMKLLGM
jgi:hypothetical protein